MVAGQYPIFIVAVNACYPFRFASQVTCFEFHQFHALFVPPDDVRNQIHVSYDVLGGRGQHLEALFALSKRFFSLLTVGDVTLYRDKVSEVSGIVRQWHYVHFKPHRRSRFRIVNDLAAHWGKILKCTANATELRAVR